MRAQVCVVGSGAGGATVACELARRGHSVVLLEEGAYLHGAHFTGDPDDTARLVLRDGAVARAAGPAAIQVPTARCVGGTTVLGAGTMQRVPESVLTAWEREHGVGGLGVRDLAPYYARVEDELSVTAVPDVLFGRNAMLLERGAHALGHAGARLRRAAVGCMATGVCDRGCPQDAQLGMHVATVPRALELGAIVYVRSRAEKLLLSGARVFGVEATLLDERGVASGRRLRVVADRVVVAAGALATPALLARSGVANGSGQLGRNLHVQPAARVVGLFPEDVHGFAEVPQTYEVEQFVDEGIVIHGELPPPAVLARALPSVGRLPRTILERYPRLGGVVARIADRASGTVRVRRDGRALAEYRTDADDRRLLVRAMAHAAELLFAAGASEVYPALRTHPVLRSIDEAIALRDADAGELDVVVAGHHAMGTARMADDAKIGVTSAHGAVHGVQDLYVADASLLPTATTVAPQATIIALALRIAEHISADVGAPL